MNKRLKLKIKPLTETEKTRLAKMSAEVMNGLLSSRGQYPLSALESQAKDFAKTAVILARALIVEIEEG